MPSNKHSIKLDDVSLRLWLRLLSCTKRIENEIRTKLREQHDTTLPRFDVMAQLYRCPDGLRMGEISQRLMVTGGNITGIVEQLLQEGLVERVADATDRRAYVAKLTTAGFDIFEKMADEHHRWVTMLMAGLLPQEQEHLLALLTKLRDTLQKADLLDFNPPEP